MVRRLLVSGFFAVVACGLSFYVFYFIGLIYTTVAGAVDPANTHPIQAGLRHIALPLSVGLAVVVFVLAFIRWGKRVEGRNPAKVISIR